MDDDYLKYLKRLGMSNSMLHVLTESERINRQIRELSESAVDREILKSIERYNELSRPNIPSLVEQIDSLYPSKDIYAALQAGKGVASIADTIEEIQNFNLPSISLSVASYLHDADMLKEHFERYHEALKLLVIPPDFIGDFEIEGDGGDADADADEEERAIILPEEIQERLVQVEFIPARLISAIHNSPELMRGLEPRDFERLVAELLHGLGFECVELTPTSKDGGRDIIAVQKFNGIPILMNFECKRYSESQKIGPSIMRSLLGVCDTPETKANIGVLVTTSTFTSGAKRLIFGEARLDGKDFNDVVSWLQEYFESRTTN